MTRARDLARLQPNSSGQLGSGALDLLTVHPQIQAVNTTRQGYGTFTANHRDGQLLTWTGTKNNGTIDLLTNTSWNENGHAGIFFLNMVTSGLGVSRIYTLTGRYALCNLNMMQGGNRGAGEDAYLSINGGTNSIGLQLTSSGFPAGTAYSVVALLGVNYIDKWFTN